MDISLLNIMRTVRWDFRHDMAQNYANALKNAITLHVDGDVKKKQGYFLSKLGTKTKQGNFQDSLYIGNIHRIENHLKWNDEELADDDQIINVVVIDGPVTRDGGACSYGTKDFRDQVMYANTIKQVVGHLFIINTPGGESVCRKDYEMMINDCREKGKPTVAFVDGMCCSSGVNLACRLDRVVVMNPKDDFGCIGSMAAFWATPDGAVDQDGTRYVEIVGDSSPEKNDWYRQAAAGDYDNLKKMVNEDTEDFHQTVRENRPLVEDWMLKGSTYPAQQLIPALVDEIGNMDRAIQCIFDLADGKLAPARTAVKPKDGEDEKPDGDPKPQQEPETPTPDQSKHDLATQKQNEMTDEEKKKAQAAQAEGTKDEQENPAVDPNKKDANEGDPNEGNEPDNNGNPDEGGSSSSSSDSSDDSSSSDSSDESSSSSDEGTSSSSSSEEDATVGGSSSSSDDSSSSDSSDDSSSSSSNEPSADPDPANNDAAELAKVKDALNKANGTIKDRTKSLAEKDKTIAKKDKAIAEKDKALAESKKAIADRDESIKQMKSTISQLTKKVDELTAEVKELAAKPEPVGDKGGIPQSNGVGAQPTQKKYIKRGMTYEEVRAAKKQEAKDREAAKKAQMAASK